MQRGKRRLEEERQKHFNLLDPIKSFRFMTYPSGQNVSIARGDTHHSHANSAGHAKLTLQNLFHSCIFQTRVINLRHFGKRNSLVLISNAAPIRHQKPATENKHKEQISHNVRHRKLRKNLFINSSFAFVKIIQFFTYVIIPADSINSF